MKLRNSVYRSLFVAAALSVIAVRAFETPTPSQQQFRRLGELTLSEVNESSGLAISRRTPNTFWTHNDSGDGPRIFSFDKAGQHLGTCRLVGARAVDWEDMSSFQRGGKNWLLIADVGDNALDRPTCSLYLCEEPPPTARQVDVTAISFRYEDGPHNCESVAVDLEAGVILLVTKGFSSQSKVYQLSLPDKASTEVAVARAIATVPVPLATSMDITADGRHAVILTYADAFQFERQAGESWQQAFAKPPLQRTMPIRRQGEAICFDPDCQTLYLTSEKHPCPLWEVPPLVATKDEIVTKEQ